MKTWWRVIAGLAAGAANSYANGVSPKQIGFSVLIAAMGLISHLTSTSDPTEIDGTKASVAENAAKKLEE